MPAHLVTALQLNLRATADPSRRNVVAVLPQGTEVTRLANSPRAGWWEVEAAVAGVTVRGHLNSSFLGPLGTAFPASSASAGRLPPADLGSKSTARRSHAGSWAHSIGEAGKPGRASTDPGGKAAGIIRIIDWLDVAGPSHLRWKPGQFTYCNIYVYDVCDTAGCYLPRVWWSSKAIADLRAGRTVEAKYGVTVNEMAANYIYNWLVEHGADFGWQRTFDLDTLQSAANQGKIAIICAQRTQMNAPGHIQIIAPEHGTHAAKRSGGRVTQPLQSQAGRTNFSYGFLGSTWWQGSKFREFGFWIHDL